MTTGAPASATTAFARFDGASELHALMRSHDWSGCPLGEPAHWPASLQAIVSLMLANHQRMFVAWGPELTFLYNDSYRPTLGRKHPGAIGRPFREVWPEIWPDIGPLVQRALHGESTTSTNLHLVMQRNGYPEDAWFDISYSPLRDESGHIAGLFCIGAETTAQVLAERETRASQDALHRINQSLEVRIEERTAERDRLWELSEDLLVSADYDGRLLRVSPSWTRLLGHDRESLLSRPYGELLHPDDTASVMAALEQMRRGNRSTQFDTRVRTADGSWRWFAWTLSPDPGRSTLHGVGRDITALKERAAATRRLSHERFFAAIDISGTQMGAVLRATDWAATPLGAPEGWPTTLRSALGIALNSAFPVCLYWGPEYRLLYNDAFIPILGARHPAAFAEPAREVWSDIWGVLDPMFRGVVESGQAVHTVDGLVPLRRHGRFEECFFNYNVSPIYGDDGRIAGLFNSAIETTYRVVAERRGRLLRSLADRSATARSADEACRNAADIIGAQPADVPFCLFYLIDDDTPSLARLAAATGLAADDPARPTVIDLDAGAGFWTLPAEGHAHGMVVDTGFGARHATPVVLAPWPEPVTVAFVVPIADAARPSLPVGLMVAGASPRQPFDAPCRSFIEAAAEHVATAIGNARAHQAERLAADELERRVAERTADLEHAQHALRQAQKMEAVGQLTGGIAHDFNNFLAGIVGALELMRVRLARGQVEQLERHITAAMASARRAAALTHRLLAFSRRQPLDPKPVDANQLAASMEDLLRQTIGPAHALEVVVAPALWVTRCDPHQLESAILNLAINARDAMPGGGRLTISTANARLDEAEAAAEVEVLAGEYVQIAVADTGIGMSAEVISRAVEPFFTTKPLGQGTGLGLSMVYGFAKQSEGHFRIDSEVGLGTTVRIYLPRHRGGTQVENATAPEALAKPVAASGETVLVVEDDPVIRDLIVELLQDQGFRALAAADGLTGLAMLQSGEAIDLLVTDLGLPGLDGRELVARARLTRPALKVLFITGFAQSATPAEGFLDRRMAMLTKPFSMQALAAKVESMLREG